MMYLAKMVQRNLVKNGVAFIGAQRHDLLPLTFTPPPEYVEPSAAGDPVLNVEEFKKYNVPAVITTDDGSIGMKGYVTQALRRFLEERQVQFGKLSASTVVYCCGPTPMMKATARVAAEFEVPCQVSLEQPMACGMGTCQSCVIRYRPRNAAAGTDWKYKLTCTDGPVFDSRDILW
jgi:dihydroorotate dehydrogenase electron transfer subunit